LLDGSGLDPTFGVGGKVLTTFLQNHVPGKASGLAIQADGKLVVAGSLLPPDHSNNDTFALARYTADGGLDPTFGTDGTVTTPVADSTPSAYPIMVSDVVLQADEKIVVVGSLQGSFVLARYTAAGGLDPTFGTSGIVTTHFADYYYEDPFPGVVLQADGKIVVSASLKGDVVLARYTAAGGLDPTFGTSGIVTTHFTGYYSSGTALGVALQADGKIVVAGSHLTPYGSSGFTLARYTADGRLDPTFGTGGTVTTGSNSALDSSTTVAVQDDGKIIVAGAEDDYDIVFEPGDLLSPYPSHRFIEHRVFKHAALDLLRYNPDGSADTTFGMGGKVATDAQSPVQARRVVLQSDGKIIVAGSVGPQIALWRYTSGGGLDTTFSSGGTYTADFASEAAAVGFQADGKIVVAGGPSFLVARLLNTVTSPVQFSAAAYSVHKNGGSATITVTRTGDSNQPVTVRYATGDGTATAGTHYSAVAGTLTFNPGTTSQTFTIPIRDNGRAEGPRTLTLILSQPTGVGILGSTSTAVLTILDDNQDLTIQQRFVTQVYLDLLQRRPEPAGLAVWTGLLERGVGLTQVAQGILHSPEYRAVVVQGLYQTLLHRPADPTGLNLFVGTLAAGATRQQAEAAIMASPEYFQNRGGGTPDGFLDALYHDGLNRAIDSTGQTAFRALLAKRAARGQVADVLFRSDEFREKQVREWYPLLLGRAVDSSGLNGFVNALKQGMKDEEIVTAILTSVEYFTRLS
jgi:uncharacterized delta-60 repeat protein